MQDMGNVTFGGNEPGGRVCVSGGNEGHFYSYRVVVLFSVKNCAGCGFIVNLDITVLFATGG